MNAHRKLGHCGNGGVGAFGLRGGGPGDLFYGAVLHVAKSRGKGICILYARNMTRFSLAARGFAALLRKGIADVCFGRHLFVNGGSRMCMFGGRAQGFSLACRLTKGSVSVTYLRLSSGNGL